MRHIRGNGLGYCFDKSQKTRLTDWLPIYCVVVFLTAVAFVTNYPLITIGIFAAGGFGVIVLCLIDAIQQRREAEAADTVTIAGERYQRRAETASDQAARDEMARYFDYATVVRNTGSKPLSYAAWQNWERENARLAAETGDFLEHLG